MKIVRKILKWLAISICTFVILIILTSLIMNVIFGRELRQTMEKLKSEGRALTIAEIRPAPAPDDQNAAPLFQKAAELMGYAYRNKPAPKTGQGPAIKELSGLINSNNTSDITTWPATQREALPRLIQAPEMAQLFAILHEASKKPDYNNNLKYEDGPATFLPNLGSIRMMIRFLSIKAELAAQNGNTNEAFLTVQEGLKLAHLLRQEPNLVTQLVRISCDKTMIDCMERMSDKTDVPSDQANALIAELEQATDPKPWVWTMEMERVAMAAWIFNLMTGRSSVQETRDVFNVSGFCAWVFKYAAAPLMSWTKKDICVYLKLMCQLQDYYKVPYWEAAETIRNNPTEQQIPRYCFLTRFIFPNLDRIATSNAEHDAAVAVARIGLGLKLFKQKNGAYPDAPDKLAPEFLDTIPPDPFTGKALIYRKDGNGFILYSLGPNQHDDNGAPKPTGRNATGKEPYDIVWKCEK